MTHEELLSFGERLRNRRDVLGLTQEFVSTEAGISLRFYQMIERGEKGVSPPQNIMLFSMDSSAGALFFIFQSNPPLRIPKPVQDERLFPHLLC